MKDTVITCTFIIITGDGTANNSTRPSEPSVGLWGKGITISLFKFTTLRIEESNLWHLTLPTIALPVDLLCNLAVVKGSQYKGFVEGAENIILTS